jgi:hypothetical protein
MGRKKLYFLLVPFTIRVVFLNIATLIYCLQGEEGGGPIKNEEKRNKKRITNRLKSLSLHFSRHGGKNRINAGTQWLRESTKMCQKYKKTKNENFKFPTKANKNKEQVKVLLIPACK